MKRNQIIVVCTLLLACFALGSCSDVENNYDNGLRTGNASMMEILKDDAPVSDINFSVGKGNTMIAINTDGEWTAEVGDESWCHLAVHAGYGYANKMSYNKIEVDKNESGARSTVITFRSGGVSKTVNITQNGTGTDPNDPFMSAFTFVERLKYGYNLGNTLEANHDITNPSVQQWFNPQTIADWETCWGQPLTTQEIIDAIAAKGFNVIRVPVTWFPHMDADGNVDPVWMNRVQEVVNMVLNAGCYCILNVHHDASEYDPNRGDGAHWLLADLETYPQISAKFKHLWMQIANHFKGYDDRLVFEAFNEILSKKGEWGNPSDPSCYEAINLLEQDFVDVVRATGGNNEYRNLLVNPYGAGSTAEKLAGMQAPKDVHPNHILCSVHSYDPYWFCNDSDDPNAESYYIYMFNDDAKKEIDDIFARVDKRFNGDFGMPYIFGEFAAGGSHVSMAERVKYTQYMKQKFQQYNTTGLWWMGLMDRNTLEWTEIDIVNALFQ